ncbi:MAG: hypothetical protein QNJ44_09850 [Rhodobacter sp.]|nr:hypothetical protein [Rhodobacter sp.]
MSPTTLALQPGPIFYDVFVGGLKAQGRRIVDFAAAQEVRPGNLKAIAAGVNNGERSQAVRQAMIDAVGEETFLYLFRYRLRFEEQRQ